MRKENNPAAYPSDNKIILLIVFARIFFLRNERMANASLKLLKNTLNLLS